MSTVGSKKQLIWTIIFDFISIVLCCTIVSIFIMRYNLSVQGQLSPKILDTELFSVYNSILLSIGMFGSIMFFLHIRLVKKENAFRKIALYITFFAAVSICIVVILLQYLIKNLTVSLYCLIFVGIFVLALDIIMLILSKSIGNKN